MGCKSPDLNCPFGGLAGGQVCGVIRRLKDLERRRQSSGPSHTCTQSSLVRRNLCEPTVSSAREGWKKAGSHRTEEPSSSTGVLERARGDSRMIQGREISCDAGGRWQRRGRRATEVHGGRGRSPRGAEDRSRVWDNTPQPEGRDPAAVTECNAVEEVVSAIGLPTPRTQFGSCSGPSMPRPNRQRRPHFLRATTRYGVRRCCGRPGSQCRPTTGPPASMGRRVRPESQVDKQGRGSGACASHSERRPPDATQCDGWISRSPQVGHAHSASQRSQIGWCRRP